jgi:hypothetical protein
VTVSVIASRDRWIAAAIVAGLLLAYNANGREIGSYDSQPTKFAARELLLRGTLTLNHVVGGTPTYAERMAFVLTRDGRYRSAYSPVPAIAAAVIAYPLVQLHLLDLRSPLAPNRIAVVGASVLTALAVGILYLTARQRTSRRAAILLSLGLGLGTGLWCAVSRTLWQHETAIFGMAIAMAGFASTDERLGLRQALWTGIGLALAGTARPQLAPMVAVILAGVWGRAPRRAAAAATAIVGGAAAILMFMNWRWFGTPLGAVSNLGNTNDVIHLTKGWIDWHFEGVAGLLVSPSRGLLVYSPIVAVAFAGFVDAVRAPWGSPLRWCAAAAAAEFLLYGSYSVWWAGHTYGPRYLLDVLPVLVPLAAAAVSRIQMHRVAIVACTAALAWSIALSATGAFFYPHERWNSEPVDVDRDHARLWEWSDPQFVRCWRTGPSPQNFALFAASEGR